MVIKKDINNHAWDDLDRLIFNHPGFSNIKDEKDLRDHAKKISGIIAEIAVEYTINRIRVEEPYLIYTQQERL